MLSIARKASRSGRAVHRFADKALFRCLVLAACLLRVASSVAAADPADDYNVVWDSPSAGAAGSMPLGNGDIALNAWVEPSGALAFYIAKTDSWGDNARLLKIGKVCITLDPPPPVNPFRQELSLSEGAINVRYGDGTALRVWVDANHPAVGVSIRGDRATTATAAVELWRTSRYTLPSLECSDVLNRDPKHTPTVVEPDTILAGQKDRIGWYHHNTKSVGPALHAEVQGMTGYKRDDPLLNRIFGAIITCRNPKRIDDTHLQSAAGKEHAFDIYVLTEHPSTPGKWLANVDRLIQRSGAADFEAHKRWWAAFWSRSWIRAAANTEGAVGPVNAHPLRAGIDQHGANKLAGELRNVRLPENLSGSFTIEAEVKPAVGATGRIFDKITPGVDDGFLLDLLAGNTLRLIVGKSTQTAKNVLPPGEWSKVVLAAGKDGWRVTVNGKDVLTAPGSGGDEGKCVSQMFALQRFVTACAGRGRYPIKFNGSLFTVPAPGCPGDADYRRWGPGYWWQNTRLPYISMCANGDFEMMEPLWRMYVDDFLPLNRYRTKQYFNIDNAAYYIECVHFWGDVFNESYGWQPMSERKDPLQQSGYHKREWVSGPELVWMMLDNYEHTQDETLLTRRIVPCADAVMRFFDGYYKTGAGGRLVMNPSQALETWWDCTNPMPELSGLRAITARLLALPESTVPAASRAYWMTFQAKLPPLPTRDTPTGKALAPAEKYAAKANVENPELYAVFPFRLCSFEKDNRDLAVQALKHRWDGGSLGWRQDDIFMAYLGMAQEARRFVVERARTHDRNSRFPAFWGPNYDWIPDQDHGGVLMKAVQAMLMQTEGAKIYLLPAWPKDWDVDFKLHAPAKTTVRCVLRGGRIETLEVVPESRRKDVVIVGQDAAKPASN